MTDEPYASPAAPDRPGDRDQLASALRHESWCHVIGHGDCCGTEDDEFGCDCGAWDKRRAVDRMIRQAQAEALESAAEQAAKPVDWGIRAVNVADLHDRAAALRATTDHMAVTEPPDAPGRDEPTISGT